MARMSAWPTTSFEQENTKISTIPKVAISSSNVQLILQNWEGTEVILNKKLKNKPRIIQLMTGK